MILISHRGNIEGPSPDNENNPRYIQEALSLGYNVEIDVWCISSEIYLGHDSPLHKVSVDFLKNKMLWCHAKNIDALSTMLKADIHCFWHDKDEYTLTSRGIIWASPESYISSDCIWVMPEKSERFKDNKKILDKCLGVCSDIVKKIDTDYRS
jgi:alpha-glucosidase (family GH31 glycosyl hydrolase)